MVTFICSTHGGERNAFLASVAQSGAMRDTQWFTQDVVDVCVILVRPATSTAVTGVFVDDGADIAAARLSLGVGIGGRTPFALCTAFTRVPATVDFPYTQYTGTLNLRTRPLFDAFAALADTTQNLQASVGVRIAAAIEGGADYIPAQAPCIISRQIFHKGDEPPPAEQSDFLTRVEAQAFFINRDEIGSLAGPQGERGEQGLTGTQGIPGERGEKGETGDRGEKGERGERGERGDQGQQGIPGVAGARGERGDRGEQGIAGERGEKGDTGDPGERGEQGERGEMGDRGERGERGEQGQQGIPGATGARGERGERGEQGIPGNDGAPGAKGETGAQGERGEQGIPGTNGAPGAKGETGAQGERGEQGIPGTNGTPGAKGETGAQGERGEQGIPGTNGTNGTDGRDGVDGSFDPNAPVTQIIFIDPANGKKCRMWYDGERDTVSTQQIEQ